MAGVSGHLGLFMIQDEESLENKFRTTKQFIKAATGAHFVYISGTSKASWAIFLLLVHEGESYPIWYNRVLLISGNGAQQPSAHLFQKRIPGSSVKFSPP